MQMDRGHMRPCRLPKLAGILSLVLIATVDTAPLLGDDELPPSVDVIRCAHQGSVFVCLHFCRSGALTA